MENVVFVKNRGTATVGSAAAFVPFLASQHFGIHFVSLFARTVMFIHSDGDQMCTRRGLIR